MGCAVLPIPGTSSADTELLQQLDEYLYGDALQAENLLPRLSGHSLPDLEAALVTLRTRSFRKDVPRGTLPHQPITIRENTFSYGLYVPLTYEPSRSLPLIVCLHGAGFGGDAYLDRWQPRLGEDYILVCPSIPGGAWWTSEAEELVLGVLSEISRIYHVDLNRVFLTGMSNGGVGTFLIGLNHADRFAALIPMASAWPVPLFPLLDNASGVPFYLIHGSRDQVMPIWFSRKVAEYLERNGHRLVYREHDQQHPVAGGHFFPQEELPDLIHWLRDRSRQPMPQEITLVRDRDHPGRAYWVRIDAVSPETGSFWASQFDEDQNRRLQEGMFAHLSARISGNTIWVTTDRVLRYSLLLEPGLVDLHQPVRVITNGQTSFEGMARPEARILLQEIRQRPDLNQQVQSVIKIQLLE